MPLIEVDGLRHAIAGRPVLDIPHWSVEAGRHCLLLGPSGSGKTTLIHALAGLKRPDQGRILLDGQAMWDLNAAGRDRLRGRLIGIVFQTLHLVPALDVGQNLHLARWLAGLPRDARAVAQALDRVGLGARLSAKPEHLSQGEKQRVAIARAVVTAPKLILADEPTSALDDENCGLVLDLLLEQATVCGATLLVATHDERTRARITDRLELPKLSAPVGRAPKEGHAA
ncbi:ABC transporter ATP-binding protein [Nitrospirillum pindoramense]|uniref:Putative ABC transport system ATP-binding protein n=1 Tax=Nitrospirillum amazonense TaxID=28077 RepID=A0A560GVS5_9PROT|nr:ATP-binding cassette domain-containing protein [Nitrospirillum amazonense]TWB38136.1 putative ABC transport system ATP-binding protein [Nitrospirillum amazonense]